MYCQGCGSRGSLVPIQPAQKIVRCDECGWESPVWPPILSRPQPRSADPTEDVDEPIEMAPGVMNERLN